jgi:hypothetical protein
MRSECSNDPGDTAGRESVAREGASDALSGYRLIPPSERNWRRDAGFQALPDKEKRAELVQEAIRDTRLLSQTLRHAVSDATRQNKLRDMLLEIEFELQKDE